jgi:predicted kinase
MEVIDIGKKGHGSRSKLTGRDRQPHPAALGKRGKPVLLYVMVGIPGSGKTTWVRRNLPESVVRVSSEPIRNRIYGGRPRRLIRSKEALVWDEVRSKLVRNLDMGNDTALDTMGLNRYMRAWIRMIADDSSRPVRLIAVFMDTPLEIAIARNRRRKGMVPDSVVSRMAAGFEPPEKVEGFERIVRVRP